MTNSRISGVSCVTHRGMPDSTQPKIDHPALCKLLRQAYSAERAASFAYIGHAGSLKDSTEIGRIREIEQDEWDHRKQVLLIMQEYGIPISRWLELKFFVIGKVIGLSLLFYRAVYAVLLRWQTGKRKRLRVLRDDSVLP